MVGEFGGGHVAAPAVVIVGEGLEVVDVAGGVCACCAWIGGLVIVGGIAILVSLHLPLLLIE